MSVYLAIFGCMMLISGALAAAIYFFQRPEFVGYKKKPGWKAPLPHYKFKCPIHGEVESYPHGYDEKLYCQLCLEEDEIE